MENRSPFRNENNGANCVLAAHISPSRRHAEPENIGPLEYSSKCSRELSHWHSPLVPFAIGMCSYWLAHLLNQGPIRFDPKQTYPHPQVNLSKCKVPKANLEQLPAKRKDIPPQKSSGRTPEETRCSGSSNCEACRVPSPVKASGSQTTKHCVPKPSWNLLATPED